MAVEGVKAESQDMTVEDIEVCEKADASPSKSRLASSREEIEQLDEEIYSTPVAYEQVSKQ